MDSHKTKIDALLVFLAGSSYGFIVPVIKGANEVGLFPHSFLTMQYMVALAICVAVCIVRGIRPKSFASAGKMALLGLCTGATSICYYTAVTFLPSAVALTLLFQYVWVSVLIECIVERHLPSRSTVIAIVIVLIGTLFGAGLFDGSLETLNPIGIVFGAGSAVAYALYLYLAGRVGAEEPTAVRTGMLAVGGIVITSIVNPAFYATQLFDASLWPIGIVLSILGILFPTSLINYASPRLTPGMVSIMASSELPVGILAAWWLVADTPTPLVLFGAFLVLFGIFVKALPTLRHRSD